MKTSRRAAGFWKPPVRTSMPVLIAEPKAVPKPERSILSRALVAMSRRGITSPAMPTKKPWSFKPMWPRESLAWSKAAAFFAMMAAWPPMTPAALPRAPASAKRGRSSAPDLPKIAIEVAAFLAGSSILRMAAPILSRASLAGILARVFAERPSWLRASAAGPAPPSATAMRTFCILETAPVRFSIPASFPAWLRIIRESMAMPVLADMSERLPPRSRTFFTP